MTQEPCDKHRWNSGHVSMCECDDVRQVLLFETSGYVVFIRYHLSRI